MSVKIEEKLYTLRYKRDDQPHLIISNPNVCLKCAAVYGVPQPCISICPADVYSWEENKIVVAYENCVECGACKIACPYHNIIWKFPKFGQGVSFRYG